MNSFSYPERLILDPIKNTVPDPGVVIPDLGTVIRDPTLFQAFDP